MVSSFDMCMGIENSALEPAGMSFESLPCVMVALSGARILRLIVITMSRTPRFLPVAVAVMVVVPVARSGIVSNFIGSFPPSGVRLPLSDEVAVKMERDIAIAKAISRSMRAALKIFRI